MGFVLLGLHTDVRQKFAASPAYLVYDENLRLPVDLVIYRRDRFAATARAGRSESIAPSAIVWWQTMSEKYNKTKFNRIEMVTCALYNWGFAVLRGRYPECIPTPSSGGFPH